MIATSHNTTSRHDSTTPRPDTFCRDPLSEKVVIHSTIAMDRIMYYVYIGNRSINTVDPSGLIAVAMGPKTDCINAIATAIGCLTFAPGVCGWCMGPCTLSPTPAAPIAMGPCLGCLALCCIYGSTCAWFITNAIAVCSGKKTI